MLNAEMRASLRALGAVRRRMRWQAAADGAAAGLVAAAAIALVGGYLHLVGAIGRRGVLCAVGAAALCTVGGAIAGALGRIALARVAKRTDASHGLADRLGSALYFSALHAPTPFMRAAIADAEAAAERVQPGRAAPFRRPPHLAVVATCAGLAVALQFLRFPVAAVASRPAAPPLAHLAIDRDLLEPERDLARELARDALDTDDPDLKQLADQLNQLLAAVDRRELTRKEVFEKLAELERKALAGDHGSFDELKQKLRRAGEQMGSDSLARDAALALKQDDLARAKQELEQLAKQLEEKKLDPREAQKLARALEQAAREQPRSPSEKKAESEQKKLAEEHRRLQREVKQEPKNADAQRRLQKNQRHLEELKREQQQQQQAQRRLERLQRSMQSAASQMRAGGSEQQKSAQAMRDAASELGKMQDEIRKLGNAERAQGAIAQLTEVMRRIGREPQPGQKGQDKSEQRDPSQAGEPATAAGQSGPGQPKGPHGEKLHDYLARAGQGGQGQKPDEKIFLPGEPGGDGKPEQLLLPMGQGHDPGGGQGPDRERGLTGDGIGNSHDPNLHGAATQLAGKRHGTRVEGKMGAGPSKSETILGSAEKGFATTGYRRVYGDYSSVVEEVMSKEQVPPGYRYYVKRYFQLIKPRE